MALSGAERQRRWRERHPEQANAHLEALKVKNGQDKAVATECDHEDRGVRVTLIYCGRCRKLLYVTNHDLEDAHEKWRSRPPELDD